MEKYTVNIDPRILNELRKRAKEEGRTTSDMVRQAIAELLKPRKDGKRGVIR